MKYGWEIKDVTDWNHITDDLNNKNWQQYPFTMSFLNNVPESSGVYIIAGAVPLTNKSAIFETFNTPLYIGSSNKSIKDRFKKHLSNTHPNPNMPKMREIFSRLTFWFLKIPLNNDSNLEPKDYEQILIN